MFNPPPTLTRSTVSSVVSLVRMSTAPPAKSPYSSGVKALFTDRLLTIAVGKMSSGATLASGSGEGSGRPFR